MGGSVILRELNQGKCKTYLVACEQERVAVLIDPVKERIERYLAVLAYERCRLLYALDTHTHADHRSGCAELAALVDTKIVMHRRAPSPRVDLHLNDGDTLPLGALTLRFLETPGHTPDGLSLVVGGAVFTGDTLLIGGTGRSDFAGGDAGAQYDAITQKYFTLPDDTVVYPAHDYRGNTSSTIGDEKRRNPRLSGKSREDYIELMKNLGLPLPDKIQEVLLPNSTAVDDDRVKFPTLAELSTVRQLPAGEVKARLESSTEPPFILDVREPGEWSGELGHIEGSTLIPLRHLTARATELEPHRDRELVVVCRSGVRSSTAAAILTSLGFERVYNLRDGILAWHEAGLPVVR